MKKITSDSLVKDVVTPNVFVEHKLVSTAAPKIVLALQWRLGPARVRDMTLGGVQKFVENEHCTNISEILDLSSASVLQLHLVLKKAELSGINGCEG